MVENQNYGVDVEDLNTVRKERFLVARDLLNEKYEMFKTLIASD